MTTKSMFQVLDDHLRRLHAYVQNFEEQTRRIVEATARVGREADATEADLAAYVASGTEVDWDVFAQSLADTLLTIHFIVSNNKELEETMQLSITNKIANALMIVRNLDLLAQVSHILIANQLSLVRSKDIMAGAVAELKARGGDGAERLKWMAEVLKEHGY